MTGRYLIPQLSQTDGSRLVFPGCTGLAQVHAHVTRVSRLLIRLLISVLPAAVRSQLHNCLFFQMSQALTLRGKTRMTLVFCPLG